MSRLKGWGMNSVATIRQDREVTTRTADGVELTLSVRRLRRSHQIACAQLAGGESALIAAVQMWIFRAAVTAVVGAKYKHTRHAQVDQLAPVELFDDVDASVVDAVCKVAAPEIFDPEAVEEQRKNSSTPPAGSTAVSG